MPAHSTLQFKILLLCYGIIIDFILLLVCHKKFGLLFPQSLCFNMFGLSWNVYFRTRLKNMDLLWSQTSYPPEYTSTATLLKYMDTPETSTLVKRIYHPWNLPWRSIWRPLELAFQLIVKLIAWYTVQPKLPI